MRNPRDPEKAAPRAGANHSDGHPRPGHRSPGRSDRAAGGRKSSGLVLRSPRTCRVAGTSLLRDPPASRDGWRQSAQVLNRKFLASPEIADLPSPSHGVEFNTVFWAAAQTPQSGVSLMATAAPAPRTSATAAPATFTPPGSAAASKTVSLKIYISGKYYDKEDAKISVYDHGLLYGDGIFEGMRSYGGKVFRL